MDVFFSGGTRVALKDKSISLEDNKIQGLPSYAAISSVHDYHLLELDEQSIIYDLALSSKSELPSLSQKLDLYLARIDQGYNHHLDLLESLGGARFVVPFPTVNQMAAVDFCREIMMRRLGVPKFFMPGQSLMLMDIGKR